MRRLHLGWITLLLLLTLAPTSQAQIYFGGSRVQVSSGVFGFSLSRRNKFFGLSVRRNYGAFYGGPYGYSQTRIIYQTPRPIIIAPSQDLLLERVLLREMFPPVQPPPPKVEPAPVAPPPAPVNPRLLDGDPAGGFRPINPENRRNALEPFPPLKPEPLPKPKDKPKDKPDEKPKEKKDKVGRVVPPRPDKVRVFKDDHERWIYFGKLAFAEGKHGLAAERFRKASEKGDDGTGLLLLGEAQFALGQYRQARQSLLEGLTKKPDWVTSDFRPIELYGDNVAEHLIHHVELENVLANHPKDETLRFLYAYHLWFEGRRKEAQRVLEELLPTFPQPKILEQFLEALPGAPML